MRIGSGDPGVAGPEDGETAVEVDLPIAVVVPPILAGGVFEVRIAIPTARDRQGNQCARPRRCPFRLRIRPRNIRSHRAFPNCRRKPRRHVQAINGNENVVIEVSAVSAVDGSAACSANDLMDAVDLSVIVEMLVPGEVDTHIMIG